MYSYRRSVSRVNRILVEKVGLKIDLSQVQGRHVTPSTKGERRAFKGKEGIPSLDPHVETQLVSK
jgi:hypothetical protein